MSTVFRCVSISINLKFTDLQTYIQTDTLLCSGKVRTGQVKKSSGQGVQGFRDSGINELRDLEILGFRDLRI